MTLRQFSIRFVFGLFAVLGLIALFNRIVDPFWYYRDIEIKGFNAVKTQFEHYERHVKPALLEREKPDAIILGNSFSEIGLDPTNPLFTDHGRLKGMNFALAGAPWGMVQCDFEFAVAHASIKRAIVGFTPGNLPLVDCSKDYSSIGRVSAVQLLLSDSALQASLNTISQQSRMPSHTREGMYFMPSQHSADHAFKEMLLQRLKAYRHNSNSQCAVSSDTARSNGKPAPEESFDLNGLRRMILTARKHGVELILYAYPSHAYLLELEHKCGIQSEKWAAMKQITELIDAEDPSHSHVRAYQFYGYNDITAEPVHGAHMHYWYDPGHFTPKLGNILLADMFGKEQHRLGRRLTPSTFDKDYRDFLKGRTRYLQNHPKFGTNMETLLPRK